MTKQKQFYGYSSINSVLDMRDFSFRNFSARGNADQVLGVQI